MSSASGEWLRVSRRDPCAICGRPDWCGVSADGQVAICMREESDHPAANGGFVHRLGAGADTRRTPRARPDLVLRARPDLSQRAAQLAANMPRDLLDRLSRHLGVSAESLRLLGVGWDGDRRVLSFPMTDADGNVVGIRLRDARGKKFAERGGREGLFAPRGTDATDPLLVTEGPTDTSAGLTLEFDTIGRPSCSGGVRPLAKVARGRRVVVVADADGPGRRGAMSLASTLVPGCRGVAVIEPPAPHGDLRAWLQAGATRDDVLELIDRAPVRRLRARVCGEEVGHG